MENNNNTSAFAHDDNNYFKELLLISAGLQVEQDTIDQLVKTIEATANSQAANLIIEDISRGQFYSPTINIRYTVLFRFTQPDGTVHGQELEFDINSNSLGDFFTARGAALNAFQWNIINGLRQQLENGKPASEVQEVMNQFITKFPRLNNLGV